MNAFAKIDWSMWLATLGLVISFREGALWLMRHMGHPELGNLTGLLSLLALLLVLRQFRPVSQRLVDCNNRMLKESAFAFLPICVGSLMMLAHMGKEIPLFLVVLCISTLLPLWVYARLAKRFI